MATPEKNEIASTLDGRDITRGFLSPLMLEPPDDTVLMTRGAGDYSLYREVLRDDHVKAALTQRIQSVIARPWEVKAGGKRAVDKAAAEFLAEQLEAVRWDDITAKMLYGVFYGFAVAEVMWGTDGRHVTLADIKVRDRRRFGYDGAQRLRLKTMANFNGELLPERKFWAFNTGADHDDAPYGLGLAHWLYWPVWLKRNGIRFWATFLEKFGMPTAVGKFPPGSSQEDQSKLLAALQAIQRDSAIIFPDGMQAELLEATRSGTADHASFTAMLNAAILVITIGQTASTQGTPGKLGNDQEQGEVRDDITKADADLVCMSFNATVAKWLTEFNFPGAEPPLVWRVMDEPEDLNQSAERDERLARVGYKPSLARVTEVYGEGYEAASQAAVDAVPGAAPNGEPAQFAEGDGADLTPIDAMAERMTEEAAPALRDMLDQIRVFAESAESLEQLRDWLLESYGDLDTGELAKVMQTAFAAAELSGRFDVAEEAGLLK
jgi:phage gp29-like protein